MGRKLGPIMLQFEYLNRRKMPSLGAFLERLGAFFAEAPDGFQYAIETRNKNYLKPPIAEVVAENDTATADFTVVRLHGGGREEMEERTDKVWNKLIEPHPGGIEAAAGIVRKNTGRSTRTYVNVNNHFEGSAPLTIARLPEVLRGLECDPKHRWLPAPRTRSSTRTATCSTSTRPATWS